MEDLSGGGEMGREGYRFGEEARMKPELMCEQNEKLVFIAIERELKTTVNTTLSALTNSTSSMLSFC